jgi:hypothetical protein
MILADQFFARILGDPTKLVVHKCDLTGLIRNGYDRGFVERVAKIGQLLERVPVCRYRS